MLVEIGNIQWGISTFKKMLPHFNNGNIPSVCGYPILKFWARTISNKPKSEKNPFLFQFNIALEAWF